ncbi:MAG: acyl-CoA-binding protein [Proteobacteria bacterium]|nr:acyl-CoA-binding protein [Pseudomonadota bacterium]
MAEEISINDRFINATNEVRKITKRPSDAELLTLYAFFKQATEGDVTGSRPKLLDLKGRAKYDAWAKQKGNSISLMHEEYVKYVEILIAKYRP